MACRVCYTREYENPEDTIYVSSDTIDFYDSINIGYTADLSTTKYIVVRNNSDSEVYNQTITLAEGKVTFTPIPSMGTGTYTASIKSTTSYTANTTFTVTSPANTSWGIWVDNKEPAKYEDFTIYYVVPAGHNGFIQIKRVDNNRVLEERYVSGETNTQSFVYSIEARGEYIIYLKEIINGYEYLRDDEKIYVSAKELINTIAVSPSSIELGDNVRIYGTHSYNGFNVYVKIQPGNKIIDVSGTESFSFYYTPTRTGDHNVILYLDDTELASTSFSVVTQLQPTTFQLPTLHPTIAAIVGLIIVLFIMLMPMALMMAFKTRIQLPSFVYGLLGGFGVIVNVMMGIWGIWTLYVIIVIGGLFAFVMYLNKGGGG